MRTKSKRRPNTLKHIAILMVSMVLIVMVNLIYEITTDNREDIQVIQIQTPEYKNPMMREKKPEKEPITVEEFCAILNEIEGKEIYYVDYGTKEDTEQTNKMLNVERLQEKGEGSYKNYTKEDITLLANIMYIEVEQYINDKKSEYVYKLVGSVILNRVEDPEFANTLEGVIFDNTEYAQTTLDKVYTKQIPDKVYKWAEELLRIGAIGPKDLVYQSEIKQGTEIYYQYGNQYFCLK